MIRSLAKCLPHPLLMRLHQRYQVMQQAALARQVSRRTGLPLLETLELAPLKTSDTVFILGGGSSINEISPSRWERIARHDTIAMNFWPVHAFVPRIYLFENVPRISECELMFDALQGLLQRRASDYRNTVKIVSELYPFTSRQLVFEIPQEFRRLLYVGYSANIVARDETELVAGLRYMLKKGMFNQQDRIRWQFKCAGSILAAISLAVCMGYQRIVLCGIDLRSAEYFYHDAERYPDASHWEFIPRNQPHLMARRFTWGLPAQVVISHFKRQVLDASQIELFVENRSSALFPQIPEFSFETLREIPLRATEVTPRQQ